MQRKGNKRLDEFTKEKKAIKKANPKAKRIFEEKIVQKGRIPKYDVKKRTGYAPNQFEVNLNRRHVKQRGTGKWMSGSGKRSMNEIDGSFFSKESQNLYLQTLLDPSKYMCRVPFLVGLPTALCRITSIWLFDNSDKKRGIWVPQETVTNEAGQTTVIPAHRNYYSNTQRSGQQSQFTDTGVGLDDELFFSFSPNAI